MKIIMIIGGAGGLKSGMTFALKNLSFSEIDNTDILYFIENEKSVSDLNESLSIFYRFVYTDANPDDALRMLSNPIIRNYILPVIIDDETLPNARNIIKNINTDHYIINNTHTKEFKGELIDILQLISRN